MNNFLKFALSLLSLGVITANIALAQPGTNGHKKQQHIKKAVWLLGDWQNKTAKGISTESWKKLNDSTFLGKSYVLRGADTVSAEHIRLEERHGNLLYTPTVKNQNEGKPVIFTMTTASAEGFVFENPEHDFPQKISYNLIGKDSLMAEISGTYKGKQRAIKFPMGRVK
ncbi:DUF6265 family protein [Mucilaginibacter sp. RCC_168]|jgi:hypothetical protein|uniref:DUF6265 family protein n=1 Tax=Mucilaginibacter sp. RCC_168 TaxID=3239221 RepID=UPI003525F1A9